MKIATKNTLRYLVSLVSSGLGEIASAVNTVIDAMPAFLKKTDAEKIYQPKGDYLLSSQLEDLKGPKGDKGDKGDTGAQGIQGIQGPKGADGHSPAVSVSSDGYLTVDGTKQTARNLIGPQGLKGDAGAKGDKGATGDRGPAGATGATGATGAKGDKGDKGAVFTPAVDSSGNLSWSNNEGLVNPATVNIRGPKGETGAQGPKGATGATGPQGPAGSNASVVVTNKAPTLGWGASSVIAQVNGTDITAKLPANPNTDTKNTTGASDTSSKIFLIGAPAQGASTVTYSHDTAYVGTDGCLYSGGKKTLTEHQDISGKLDKSGGTMTGTINFADLAGTGTRTLLHQKMADNDYFRLLCGGTASNSGFVEIATADDGNEPIYLRQYSGVFSTLKRTLTLLDENGDTTAPGTFTAAALKKADGTSSQFLKADGSVDSNSYLTMGAAQSTYAKKADIPSNVSQLANDMGYVTTADITGYTEGLSYYGIGFNMTIDKISDCARIGSMDLHRTLPIQNKMRGCLLDDNGNVTKYLPFESWVGETLDGSSGQVMVEIPEHYRKFTTDMDYCYVRLSEVPLPGYHRVPKMYISAYEASVDSNGKLCSVSGVCPTGNKNLSQFREAARKRKPGSTKWNTYVYEAHKTLYWLFAVEYANLRATQGFDKKKDVNGFSVGGISACGLYWSDEDNAVLLPTVESGRLDHYGSRSGTDSTQYVSVISRYRGIEMPFGHIRKWVDGIMSKAYEGYSKCAELWVCDDPAQFSSTDLSGYTKMADLPESFGYIGLIAFGERGDITSVNDIYYSSNVKFGGYANVIQRTSDDSGLYGVMFGCPVGDQNACGFLDFDSTQNATGDYSYESNKIYGTRLCFLPEAS